jgi:hypothetical protein
VEETGTNEEAGGNEKRREPRLETPEGGIERGEPKPEIGHAHFELERTIGPADRRGRLRREEDVADKGPQSLEPERKDEEIAQEPFDDEVARDGTRSLPDGKACAYERRDYGRMGTSETCVMAFASWR